MTVNITVEPIEETVNITVDETVEQVNVTAATTIEQVNVTVTEGGGGEDATVRNSNNTYNETVASGGTLVLPDTDYNIYVNTVFYATTSLPTLEP
jgi:hypothetical protein